MRLDQSRESDNIEDRRGMSTGGKAAVGGGGILVVLVALFFGGDTGAILQQLLGGAGGAGAQTRQVDPSKRPQWENELKKLVATVLGDTEDTFPKLFRDIGKTYEKPTLVIFSGQTTSGCGKADSGTGPFYCPADRKVYIDLSFYKTLKDELGAPGDFAQAYVIAHEVGHHIQNLLGQMRMVQAQRNRLSKVENNRLSVRLELQADFYAGVWAHHAHKDRNILERGDIEEALNAAQKIGDDSLQKRGRGYVEPETFTHGTSAQRMRWFKKGLMSGKLADGDTFRIPYDELRP